MMNLRKRTNGQRLPVFAALFLLVLLFSCSKKAGAQSADFPPEPEIAANGQELPAPVPPVEREEFIDEFRSAAFEKAGLPDAIKEKVVAHFVEGPDFVMELLAILEGDPALCLLVDKQHLLERAYVPDDLVELADGSYRVTRQGLSLRKAAAASLEEMAAAARADGVILTAASTYRSYDYQADLYARNVRELGKEAADRESAPPGASQHQLGLIVDFYPIEDAFAETTAFVWLEKNAANFGWSLSFPQGYEEVTGYRWESWHYRYLGSALVDFVNKYFDGIQQYALMFVYGWQQETAPR